MPWLVRMRCRAAVAMVRAGSSGGGPMFATRRLRLLLTVWLGVLACIGVSGSSPAHAAGGPELSLVGDPPSVTTDAGKETKTAWITVLNPEAVPVHVTVKLQGPASRGVRLQRPTGAQTADVGADPHPRHAHRAEGPAAQGRARPADRRRRSQAHRTGCDHYTGVGPALELADRVRGRPCRRLCRAGVDGESVGGACPRSSRRPSPGPPSPRCGPATLRVRTGHPRAGSPT